jgi:hypothetical protein
MKKINLIVLITLILTSCSKDDPVGNDGLLTRFTNDGEIELSDHSTLISKDNNLIICGNQNNCRNGIVILKITKAGELVWKTEFTKGYECNLSSIYENENEELFVCGSLKMLNTTLGASNVFIIKMSKQGDTLWTKTYGTSEIERGYRIVNSDDGCLLISGKFEKNTNPNDCLYLLKINYDGDTIWTKTYKDKCSGVEPYHLLKTSSGDYLLTGAYWVDDGRILYLAMFDTDGNIVWDKKIGTAWCEGYCTMELQNNHFLTCGRGNGSDFGYSQLMLLKSDISGNVEWVKVYGSDSLSEEGYSMILNSDNTITTSGASYNSDSPDYNIVLLKVDMDGNQLWLKTFGDSGINEWGSNLIMDENDDFFLTGTMQNIRINTQTHETTFYLRKIFMISFTSDGDFKSF